MFWLHFKQLLLMALTQLSVDANEVLLDRIVAIVEGDIITWRELQALQPSFVGQSLNQVLEHEISERLIHRAIQEAQTSLNVSERDIDKAIEEVVHQNHITRKDLENSLFAQGLTMLAYRQQLREQIERARLMQMQVQNKINMDQESLRRYCLQQSEHTQKLKMLTCAAQIVVLRPKSATANKRAWQKINQARQQALNGVDFSILVQQFSEEEHSKNGSLGCFQPHEMIDAIADAIAYLPAGGLSSIVTTDWGYHLVKVTGYQQPENNCNDSSVLNSLQNAYYQEEMNKQTVLWAKSLRQKALVEIRL